MNTLGQATGGVEGRAGGRDSRHGAGHLQLALEPGSWSPLVLPLLRSEHLHTNMAHAWNCMSQKSIC